MNNIIACKSKRAASSHISCLHVPLNSRLSCLVSENPLNVCNISALRSLRKVLLLPHVTWVSEKMPAFIHKSIIMLCRGFHVSRHLVLRFEWLRSHQSLIDRGRAYFRRYFYYEKSEKYSPYYIGQRSS